MSDEHLWTGWAASYALGALDGDERRTFEVHLETCAACRAELRSQSDVVASLGRSLPQHEPPPALRSRILDEARRVRPLRAGNASKAPPAVVPPRQPAVTSPVFARWIAAAAVLATLGLTLVFGRERERRTVLERTVAVLADSAARLDTALGEMASAVSERDSLLAAILSPDVRTARLVAEGQPPSARVYWDRQRGKIIIAVVDLPAAAQGRAYQLWGIAGGQAPVSLGVFNTGPDGRATIAFDVPPAASIDVAAITEEPAGGSPGPTSQPFLVGGISPP
jgi:anti-sigma-K factor RskA